MELTKAIETRRSIRDYLPDVTIPQEDLNKIIEAALEAPTWKNSQTGRYYIASSKEVKTELLTKALPPFNQNNSANASAIIVNCFEKNRAGFDREGNPDNELGNEWGAYDLGLANMLLCLKATDLGYDTLIMGIRDAAALREIFSIPESQEVVSVIAIGKRKADPNKPPRKTVSDVAKIF